MEFDRWTVLLLKRRDNPPDLGKAGGDALQDSHLAFLAKLHSDGRLVAAGPVEGPPGCKIAGICIFRVAGNEARSLGENDPAVRAGLFDIEVFSWSVPRGAMRFAPVRFPGSMADVDAP